MADKNEVLLKVENLCQYFRLDATTVNKAGCQATGIQSSDTAVSILARLICNTTGSLTCRLTRSLALAAAAVGKTDGQISGI